MPEIRPGRPVRAGGSFPPLTRRGRGASFALPLPDGVMVAQATLTRLVMVRIHVGQPFDAPPVGRLAHGLRPAMHEYLGFSPAHARRMALSKRSASKGFRVARVLRQFDRLSEPSKAVWTHGLRPAYTNIVNVLVAEARRMVPSLSRGRAVVYFCASTQACFTLARQRIWSKDLMTMSRAKPADRPHSTVRR